MEATLDQVVELCNKCAEQCTRRAERFLSDAMPTPSLSSSVKEYNAEQRRDDAYHRCMEACKTVNAQCPTPQEVRRLIDEQTVDVQKQKQSSPSSSSSSSSAASSPVSGNPVVFHEPQFQLRRCETAAASFVSVLFWMANAPTRYELEVKDFHERRTKDLKQQTPETAGGVKAPEVGTQKVVDDLGSVGGTRMPVSDTPAMLPGTAHLSPEQRARIEELAHKGKTNASSVQTW